MAINTIKIDQSVFIKDFVIKKGFTKYNANIILIKTGFAIDIGKAKNYEDTNF